jgi:hypothetical protein
VRPDRQGITVGLTQKLADAEISLRGFAASVVGRQFVAYAGFDSSQDADKAIDLLKKD